ncbi:hypothetical protein CBR_g52194 [Chara braunii]|uniref:DDE Tnp4 domain-containing protein n=1 Tax=Chara braunii TaxID=69332 RepID=A0A388M9Q7_CHABU|nr:hypothetical protein CBR_g52194 [Chara braunii]|eukprot:GBG91308.1 hypothetical protein CBR_g52194 [Chara braunii]
MGGSRLCDDATDEYYHQKLRMSMAMFNQIVAACAAYLEKKVTHYRMSLPVEQVIAFALYRWASGETYESGMSAFGIGRATGLQAVRDVTLALLQAYPDAIKWSVGRRRAQILRAFRDKGFPNCFGAIDCTHIYIDKPVGAPCTQLLRTQTEVLHAGAGGGGFGSADPRRPHRIPGKNARRLCPAGVQKLSYGGIDQDRDKECFDTRQKVARGFVERAFGRLKCRWRLFLRTHKTNLETLPQQFVAVCTLHNILLDAGIDFDENLLWEVDENGIWRRVDVGIVGNSAGGQRRSTNVDGDLLQDALRDRLALMYDRADGRGSGGGGARGRGLVRLAGGWN